MTRCSHAETASMHEATRIALTLKPNAGACSQQLRLLETSSMQTAAFGFFSFFPLGFSPTEERAHGRGGKI